MLVPVDIPEYLRELLAATGFDNYLSLAELDDAAMNELIEFSKEDPTKTSPLLIGHKVMLFGIRDIIRSKGLAKLSKFDNDLNTEEMVLRVKIKDLLREMWLDEVPCGCKFPENN